MHGMGEEQTGIVIRAVAPETHVAEALKVDDVLLSVEGQQVGNDGSVPFLDGERIQVTHLLNEKYRGEELRCEVLREGEVLSLSFPLENSALLVPPKPAALSYCVVAGLVFLPLSMELLNMRRCLWVGWGGGVGDEGSVHGTCPIPRAPQPYTLHNQNPPPNHATRLSVTIPLSSGLADFEFGRLATTEVPSTASWRR